MRRVRVVAAVLVPATAVVLMGSGVAQAEPVAIQGVVASGDDGNVPANTLDGDLGTRWSDEGDGVWIRYDLGTAVTVGSLSIAWHNGDQRRTTFEVQTSGDGTAWANAVSRRDSGGASRQPESYDFVDRAARYVRVVGHGNTVNDWTSITEVDIFGADSGTACRYPADVLDLTGWKVTLPTGGDEDPDEITQPALDSFAADPWFVATDSCDGVRFRSAVNGVTTGGSSYPRSELREMTADGSDEAGWSATSGTHTMTIREAITAVPAEKPHVVAGQIHDGSDDVTVFRLQGDNLYITEDDNTDHKLVDDNYVLGTTFEAKFVITGGKIKAYYNGVLQTTISADFSDGYFKAGAYTQANCGNSDPCSDSNYGEVVIHDITVTHS
ncbi:polysaccharide lyase family 7 protein [Actinophytocola glycyrrhizae]|uniref:Polysaccharide lyase family 7 protein n=1 Tax=Actinophytocola glycyrrhizae TaxID=2044873 RepID=A0ABV9S165_9PSEU